MYNAWLGGSSCTWGSNFLGISDVRPAQPQHELCLVKPAVLAVGCWWHGRLRTFDLGLWGDSLEHHQMLWLLGCTSNQWVKNFRNDVVPCFCCLYMVDGWNPKSPRRTIPQNQNRPSPKRIGSSSDHHFSGAFWTMGNFHALEKIVPFLHSGYEAWIFLNFDDLLWCCFQFDVSFTDETMRFESSFRRAASKGEGFISKNPAPLIRRKLRIPGFPESLVNSWWRVKGNTEYLLQLWGCC